MRSTYAPPDTLPTVAPPQKSVPFVTTHDDASFDDELVQPADT